MGFDAQAAGVYVIAATPFHPDGRIDTSSIDRLTDFYIASGASGITALGVMGGAMLGDKVEGAPAPEVRTVQSCTNQIFYENRTTGYHVVYEFAGKQ